MKARGGRGVSAPWLHHLPVESTDKFSKLWYFHRGSGAGRMLPNVEKSGRTTPRLVARLLAGFLTTFLVVDRLIARVELPELVSNTKAPARMLADWARNARPVDVVFVGSSYTAFGINPETVDAEAARQGVSVHSLNLGFGGAITLTCTRLCELLLDSEHPPRVIYCELSPGILNTRRPSLRYGVEQIGGLREAAVLWRHAPQERATAILSQLLSGFDRWNDIRALVECAREGAPLFNPKYHRTDRGWLAWCFGDEERAATIAREVSKRDGYWGSYQVDDFALDAVRRLIELADARGAVVRFFEMPMSGDWQRVLRADVHAGYAAALNELRALDGVEVWTCPRGLMVDEDFFDADHLLPVGAEKLSRAVAQDLVELLAERDQSLAAGRH